MSFKIQGSAKRIGELTQVSEKFKKQDFVVEVDGEYPQTLQFECSQDYTNQLVTVSTGDKITVHFDIRGREWTNKEGKTMVFNTLNVWKIDHEGAEKAKPEAPKASKPATKPEVQVGDDDDLPF